jgi:type VI secretion system protein ImpM
LPIASWLGERAVWFEQLEDLALSTLYAGFAFESFEGALQAMESLPPAPAQGSAGALGWHVGIADAAAAAGVADAVAAAALYGQSVWWTDGAERVQPCLRLCRGLPSPQAFTAMLGG